MPFYEILNFYHRAGLQVSHIHKPKITFSNRFHTDSESILLSTNRRVTLALVKKLISPLQNPKLGLYLNQQLYLVYVQSSMLYNREILFE